MWALGNENEVNVCKCWYFFEFQPNSWVVSARSASNLLSRFFWGRNRSETQKSWIQSGKSLICSDSAKVSPSNARRALLADDKTFRWALCSLPSRSLASWLFKMTSQKVPSIQKFRSSFQGPQVLVKKKWKNLQATKGLAIFCSTKRRQGGNEGAVTHSNRSCFFCLPVACLIVFCLAAHILLLESASCGSMAIYDTRSKQTWMSTPRRTSPSGNLFACLLLESVYEIFWVCSLSGFCHHQLALTSLDPCRQRSGWTFKAPIPRSKWFAIILFLNIYDVSFSATFHFCQYFADWKSLEI